MCPAQQNTTLETAFNALLTAHYPQAQRFLIAFSGGLDSTALLLLAQKLCQIAPRFHFRAIHIHHGLSPHADHWAAHCRRLCANANIPFICRRVQIDSAQGVEQGARLARYAAIRAERQPDEILLTAHHLQDQSETFFLALKRGSGPQGLKAMQPYTELDGLPIFRPLLQTPRAELEAYARAQGVDWVDDESNEDPHYDRNFLRHQVLAPLRSRWAHWDQAVARAAALCGEQQRLLEELLAEEFQKNFDQTDRTLSIADFARYSPAKQAALLRLWIARHQLPMPSRRQLNQLIQDVVFAAPDRNPEFCLPPWVLRRYQQRLYLTPSFADLGEQILPLELDVPLSLPDGLGSLLLQKNGQKLTALWQSPEGERHGQFVSSACQFNLRFRYSGKIKLDKNGMNQDIKKVWQQLNVPPWQRGRIPLIFEGEQLKSAVGFF